MLAKGPVIFDFDGTLVDSELLYAEALRTVLLGIGIAADVGHLHKRFLGIDNKSIFRQLSIEENVVLPVGIEENLQQTIEGLMQSQLKPMKGAEEVLTALAGSNVPLGIASNSTSQTVFRMLNQSGLGAFFCGRVATRDLVRAPKPAPDIYLLAAQMLGSPPERCLVVEDSPTGVAGARAAGMTVIGFSHGTAGCSAELLVRAGASSVLTELRCLLA
ncbi:MAG: HAD family phosphatase [Steroidobacteraceae bacterium]